MRPGQISEELLDAAAREAFGAARACIEIGAPTLDDEDLDAAAERAVKRACKWIASPDAEGDET